MSLSNVLSNVSQLLRMKTEKRNDRTKILQEIEYRAMPGKGTAATKRSRDIQYKRDRPGYGFDFGRAIYTVCESRASDS